jgi:hypothetical protein
MYRPTRFLVALSLLVVLGSAGAIAAAPQVEGTPVPMQAKPDFSTMTFLIGTWDCVDLSSRVPASARIGILYARYS